MYCLVYLHVSIGRNKKVKKKTFDDQVAFIFCHFLPPTFFASRF